MHYVLKDNKFKSTILCVLITYLLIPYYSEDICTCQVHKIFLMIKFSYVQYK